VVKKKCILMEYGERSLEKTEKMWREFAMPCHGSDAESLILFGLQRPTKFAKEMEQVRFLGLVILRCV
jgi:hypothetical protein